MFLAGMRQQQPNHRTNLQGIAIYKIKRKLTADCIRRADLSRRGTGGVSPGRPGERECAASRGWGAAATPAAAPQRPTPSPG